MNAYVVLILGVILSALSFISVVYTLYRVLSLEKKINMVLRILKLSEKLDNPITKDNNEALTTYTSDNGLLAKQEALVDTNTTVNSLSGISNQSLSVTADELLERSLLAEAIERDYLNTCINDNINSPLPADHRGIDETMIKTVDLRFNIVLKSKIGNISLEDIDVTPIEVEPKGEVIKTDVISLTEVLQKKNM